MDSLFLLAGVLGVGDIILLRVLWRERARRRKAESTANDALRHNYRLLDALERKAGIRTPAQPSTGDVHTHRTRHVFDALNASRRARVQPTAPEPGGAA
jgi:hypothetical protein